MNVTELEKCIDMYGNDIYAFCTRLAYSRQEAEELYQDTFLKAMERLDTIDASNNPRSYLLSITVRLWKNQKRKYAWRRRIAVIESTAQDGDGDSKEETASGLSPEEEMMEKEQSRQIRHAVAELGDKYRLPVYLYYMEEMTIQDISGILKLPEGTVKSRLYKARKILKEQLGGLI